MHLDGNVSFISAEATVKEYENSNANELNQLQQENIDSSRYRTSLGWVSPSNVDYQHIYVNYVPQSRHNTIIQSLLCEVPILYLTQLAAHLDLIYLRDLLQYADNNEVTQKDWLIKRIEALNLYLNPFSKKNDEDNG